MHLEKLTICGFKSFAEGAELLFEEGITAIVGPNGCGKSNVADAIRWALGEQKTKLLRCEKMEDIIFNGGSKLEPSQLAEVSLRLSNSDGILPLQSPDIEIKRQLDRLGESRYYLNQDNCLLRNIAELFMDTGIGVNAYSLMEQNNIDMILNAHQQDRRFLFDEVAGITKYKHRKNTALRKLQETEGNLIRINDVIHELERETIVLKEQATRAELYLQRQSELKSLDVELSWRQHNRFTQQLTTIQQDIGEVQEEIERNSKAIEDTEMELETQRGEREQYERAINDAQTQVRKLESEIERTESNIALLKERQLSSQERRQRAVDEIKGLEEQKEELNEQRKQSERERDGFLNSIKLSENKLIAQERVVQGLSERIGATSEQIENSQTGLIDAMNATSKVQNELSTISNRLEYTTVKLNNLSTNTTRSQEELEKVEKTLESTQKRKETLEIDATDITNQQTKTRESTQSAQKELRKLEAEMKGLQDELGRSVSRLKSLEELQRDYEGYYMGVKAILKASELESERFGGICGVVAELIKTATSYETAIEVALGSGIQNVITETAEYAKTAIEFLKRAKAGRVTFLPLDILRARQYSGGDNLLREPGVIGIASEVVYFDPKYTVAIEHLLGNTLLVEDMDTAIRISRKSRLTARGGSSRLVTLEGELINTSGAITGGANRTQTSGLLRRAREIDELGMEVPKLSDTLRSKDKKRRNTSENVAELQQKGLALSSRLQEKQIQLAHIKKDLEGYKQQHKRFTEQLADTQNEEESVKMEVGELEAKQKYLQSQLDSSEKNRNALSRRIERLTEQNSSEKRKLDEVTQLHTDLKIELAGKRQRIQHIENTLKTIDRDQTQIAQNISERQQHIKSDNKIREELTAQIATAQNRFLSLEGEKFQATEKVEKLTAQREEMLSQMATSEKELRSLRRKLNKHNKHQHQLEVAKTQVKMEMSAIGGRLFDKYKISVDDITKNENVQEDDDQLAVLIDELEAQIADMGSVNLMAIDDYKEHHQRRQFLCAQRSDVEKSLNATYKAIQKINETSRKRFLDTFHLIRANFQDVFAQLFGGGETDLVLMRNGGRKRKTKGQDDELSALVEETIGYKEIPADDDILECGIDIIARPPGKRPQSVTALSGGERALVAIALLFAIFKIKPSPFCVLDEVDAALDEANILRFTNLISGFAKDTQFIIITHNKRTMEIADVMYGVTMEKAGVSKLVSMKLSK